VLAVTVCPRGAVCSSALHPPRTSVVIDPRLALSPFGTLILARLSAHLAVWIAPELCELLRSGHVYRDEAERLLPSGGEPAVETEAVRESLDEWATFFAGDGPPSRAYYLGERPREGLLPSDVDASVHERFEGFARSLDSAMSASDYDLPRGALISSCFRDTVALAAALVHTPTFILSALEANEDAAPSICRYLEAWKLPVSDVSGRAGADAAALRDALATASLGPVRWSGVSFAAVHVVPRGSDTPRVFWHRL
jgi:hypothetical protein